MRLSFLLALVPALALADVATPNGSAAKQPSAAPSTIEYWFSSGGDEGGQSGATTYEPGTRLYRAADGRPVTIAKRRGEEAHAAYVLEGETQPVPFVDLTPFAFDVGGRTVTVALGSHDEHDTNIHVRVAGGGELVLGPAGQGFLSRRGGNVTAELVTGAAPVPLVKVGSHPEACADFWDIYVSAVDGVPRKALELHGVADPPAMQTSTAKLAGDTALVTTRTSEDEKHTRVTRTRYRWNGAVYEKRTSKRADADSK